jgi:hypothetical protein
MDLEDAGEIASHALKSVMIAKLAQNQLALAVVVGEDRDLSLRQTVADEVVEEANHHIRLVKIGCGHLIVG